MNAYVVVADHPIQATRREQFEIAPGRSVEAVLAELAGITPAKLQAEPQCAVLLNGQPLAADEWGYILKAGDSIAVLPRQFFTGAAAWIAAAVAAVAVVAAVVLMPEVPESIDSGQDDASPSYSATAQGNRARLGQPIPVLYGDTRYWPDFAAGPYRRFYDHDQYLYQLFSLGQGESVPSGVRVGDTPLENLADYQIEYYAPGQPITLFKTAVIESDEVSDVQIYAPDEDEYADSPYTPAYVANPVGTSLSSIEVDIVFPGGIWYMNSKGVQSFPVTVRVWVRDIDDTGTPTSSWRAPKEQEYKAGTRDPQRFTLSVPVSGRVEVRLERPTNTPNYDDFKHKTDAHWAGLRAVLDEEPVFDHPVMALKLRVDDMVSSLSERKINLRMQSKLRTWVNGAWSEPVITRNPVWAFCDAVTAHHGGRYPDENLNLPALATVAQWYEDNNIYFDGIFDTKGKLWSCLKQICGVGMAEPVLYNGVYSIRCDLQEVAEYHYGMGDMVPGSFQLTYPQYDPWGYDSVEIEFTHPETWKPETVICSVTGRTDNPQTVKLRGCTDIAQASRVGHHLAAVREFRNIQVSWRTELNGRLPNYGDTVFVSHAFPQWGLSGSVISQDGDLLELSEPVTADTGWLLLPDDAGRIQGPFQVTRGDDDYHVQLPAGHGATVRTPLTHPAKFVTTFGWAANAEQIGKRVKIRGARAVGEYAVELSAVYDDLRVYNPSMLPVPVPPATTPTPSLQITGLHISHQGTLANPVLAISWNPVATARHYCVEYAYPDSQYRELGRPVSASLKAEVEPRQVRIRVAAETADGRGPWAEITVVAGERIDAPPVVQGVGLSEPFVGKEARFSWLPVDGCDYIVVISDGVSLGCGSGRSAAGHNIARCGARLECRH